MLRSAVTAPVGLAVVAATTCRVAGANVQVTPTGKLPLVPEPEQERLMKPVNPSDGVIVAIMLAASPGAATESEAGAMETAKSGVVTASGCTTTLADTEEACVLFPL